MTMAPEEREALTAQTAPAPPGDGWGYEQPGPDGEGPPAQAPRRWRRLRRRWKPATAVLVVVACGAGGGVYYAVSRSGGASNYVTATVTTGDIRQTTSATGTIDPATQANVNFAVAGTVSKLNVKVGQKVKAGGMLATLNTATLAATVRQGQASVYTDQAKLASDKAGESFVAAEGGVAGAETTLAEDKANVAYTQASNATALTQAEQSVAQATQQLASDQTSQSQSVA